MEIYIDISSTVTPDYEQLCPKEVGFSRNETLDSWMNTCSDYMNNRVTGVDLTWSVPFKIIDNADLKEFILNKQDAVGDNCVAKIKIVDLFNDKETTFTGLLSNIEYTYLTEEELEVSMDVKIADGKTYVKATHVPASV